MSLLNNIANYLLSSKESPKCAKQFVPWSQLTKVLILAYDNQLSNVVDLLKWTNDEVKKYTVDNMHLTFLGSEYIYSRVCEFIDRRIKQ
jgi:hypothetical protein